MEIIFKEATNLGKFLVKIVISVNIFMPIPIENLSPSCSLFGGRARSIIVAERVVLNFMQRMSGIATLTKVCFHYESSRHTWRRKFFCCSYLVKPLWKFASSGVV